MIREGAVGVDENIVDIYRAELVEVLLEYLVDIPLEGSWGASQPKGGD
jgi:hypothetical protein